MKQKVQKVGSFLSSMVMPVIGAFIAWGLITAFFIPTGWLPNETLAQLVDPMIIYMLPILIAYNGGKIVYGDRGGVIGVIATMGVIVGTTIPMFLGAMIMGPIAGVLLKKLDKILLPRTKAGFEMLVNNFSAGILGFLLAILALYIVGPVIVAATNFMGAGVAYLIDKNMLFLTSIFIEPAKVLFLNNAINHGILTPLGAEQALETGKSILFLLETNPGPGLGVLLAYTIFGKGSARATAPGAIIIHFFGGIHEIYFPYILMKPLLFFAVIAGGMAGVATFSILGAGLVAPASPGSIFAIMAMAPKGGMLPILIGVAISTAVSFFVASLIIKTDSKEEDDFETAVADVKNSKPVKNNQIDANTNTNDAPLTGKITQIIFACDAGMGSSAMGASIMRSLINDAGLPIEVTNCAVKNLPKDAQFVISQESFADIIGNYAPEAEFRFVNNFLDKKRYEDIVKELEG